MDNRNLFALCVALAAAPLALSAPAIGAPPRAHPAEIAFADHGGVEDWRAEGDHTVYLQDSARHWYRAELFMPAFDLPFVEAIGIDAGPTGTLDKFGAITVHGRRYQFSSFEAVAGPPAGKHGKAKTKLAPKQAHAPGS